MTLEGDESSVVDYEWPASDLVLWLKKSLKVLQLSAFKSQLIQAANTMHVRNQINIYKK